MEEKEKYIIALPTLNEVESIEEMILALKAEDLHFFIVDSNSTDGTLEIAKQYDVEVIQRAEYGAGYGAGIRKAIDTAYKRGFDYLGFLDCDTTYPVASFRDLILNINDHDLVVGVRPMHSISWSHRIVNVFHSKLTSILFGSVVSDVNSGMRFIRVSKFYQKLDARNMGLVAQMSSFALRNNLRIKEVPIAYGKRKGSSKIRFWHTIVIAWNILLERLKNPEK